MPFNYVVYKEHRLVISTGSGLVSWEEIKTRQDQTQSYLTLVPVFLELFIAVSCGGSSGGSNSTPPSRWRKTIPAG